ncbi:MAG: carbohydrate ABC transporter permease [Desulfitobacteriaceae bacterium]|nr:carbohydrate ABC transporter permease [Desulfitobacteriaceae bacterium]MDI6914322.1 carbohydrate ABC transporter permease [Desulfitobacteriaceae bacterium]
MKTNNAFTWKRLWGTHVILILASLISIFPLLWIISTSFKPAAEVFDSQIHFIPVTPTLGNYRVLFTMKHNIFFNWLGNSALIAVSTTLLGLFLATTAAYALSRFRFPGHRASLFTFLLIQMFPGALLIVPLYQLMRAYGLLNSWFGLVLAYATTALPFCVWMLKGFFDTIPLEIEEAARVDGLSPFGSFYRIVLPLSLPGLAVTAFYSFITAWNEFMYAMTFMSKEKLYTLPVGMGTFVNQFQSDWQYLAAGAVMITIPVIVFFFFAQRYLVSGLTAGGTKG